MARTEMGLKFCIAVCSEWLQRLHESHPTRHL
jgi:hypothetical protein